VAFHEISPVGIQYGKSGEYSTSDPLPPPGDGDNPQQDEHGADVKKKITKPLKKGLSFTKCI